MLPPVILAVAATLHVQEPGPIPLNRGWELSGDGVRLEAVRGVPAIRLRTGRAIRRDALVQDGTIEFDMAVTPHRSFVYLQFRMVTDDEHEEIYFRPHKSELPDAIQYTPVWHGESNWQLYHGRGATAPVAFSYGSWMHIRLVTRGPTAALYVGAGGTPALVMTLGRAPQPGYLAFRSFVPADGGLADSDVAADIANIVVRPGVVPADFPAAPPARAVEPGLIRRWQVSPPFAAAPEPLTAVPDSLRVAAPGWPTYPVEPSGVLVIGRHVRRPARQSAVVARLVLRATTAGLRPLRLGFSDYVTVFVNGRPLFAADAHYSYDEPRQEGLIGLSQATVWLPLAAGDTEVLIAVSDGFGGWGLQGAIDPVGGATVVPPP